MKNPTSNELEELINDAPISIDTNALVPSEINSVDIAGNNRLKLIEVWRKRLANPDYHHHSLKYDETWMVNHWLDVYEWVMTHEDAIFIKDYYNAEDANPSMSYLATKRTFGKYEIADEIRFEIKDELRDRLLRRALEKKYDAGITKLLLINNHRTDEGERYKDRIDQDITVTNKNVEFKFGNDIEDTEYNNV